MDPIERRLPDDAALEARLREAELASRSGGEPGARFRELCRQRFLESAAEATAPEVLSQSGMPSRSGGHVDPVIEMALRADPRLPEARPEFRLECRRRFLVPQPSSELAEHEKESAPHASGELVTPRAAGPDSADGRRARTASGPRGRLVRFAAVAAGIAAAALVFLLPDRPRWRLEQISGAGQVLVAGRSMGEDDAAGVGQRLLQGADFRSQEARVDLALDDWLTVHVLEGTELEFGNLGDFELDGVLRLSLERGEIFLSTRPGFVPANARILIETRDGLVEVTGTSLGVLVQESFTCVCVARGQVQVHNSLTESLEMVGEKDSYVFSCSPDGMQKRVHFDAEGSEEHARHTAPLVDYAGRH